MKLWRRDRRSAPAWSDRELATSWQVVSLLLDYPTPDLVARAPALREALTEVPAGVRAGCAAYLDALEGAVDDHGLLDLQRDYVDTFDVTRKCALHLTFFVHGDTRRRGVALVEFKQAFRRAGVELETRADGSQAELPDYLPAVLEFGACYDREAAWRLLNDHRVGIELLHAALSRRGSPWLGVVDALRATLPELDGDGEAALAKLIAEGPPNEEVGIDNAPYAVDPRLSSFHPQPPADLGATIPVGVPR